MHEECRLSKLYTNGMIMMIAAGGAERDRRASRLTNDAIIAAGKCLSEGAVFNKT